MSTVASHMTTEQMLALPDNGMDRELYDGVLKEKPMTRTNRTHANVVARITHYLLQWCLAQKETLGNVFSGDVGCILQRNPDTTVGIDVAFFDQGTLERQTDQTTFLDGPPLLAVEVLSPSDTHADVKSKVDKYLAAGTSLVWIVDPDFHTITVHAPNCGPELFNEKQEITAEPHLPGFKVAVGKLFG